MKFPFRHRRLQSLALLVQVLALFCQLYDGAGLEHCPHHDLPAASVAMAHMAGHGQHDAHGQGHACRCLGDCATVVAVLPAPDSAALPELVLRNAERGTVQHRAPTSSAQFRLPPAIGPPLSA